MFCLLKKECEANLLPIIFFKEHDANLLQKNAPFKGRLGKERRQKRQCLNASVFVQANVFSRYVIGCRHTVLSKATLEKR